MTLYVNANNGKTELTTEQASLSRYDMSFVIGMCVGPAQTKEKAFERAEFREELENEAMNNADYWTADGLDIAMVTHAIVRERLQDMHSGMENGFPVYLGAGHFLDERICRLLESIEERKPILDNQADHRYMYENLDQGVHGDVITRGTDFFKAMKSSIDKKRGFTVENGVEKPLENKTSRGFFNNLLSMLNPFGHRKNKKGVSPDQ